MAWFCKCELPCSPRVMLQLLSHACSTATFASRYIAAQLEDSTAFRVLSEGRPPSYRTITRLRETIRNGIRTLEERKAKEAKDKAEAGRNAAADQPAAPVEAIPEPKDQPNFTDAGRRIMPG